ncbi:hypothetical protein C8Q76DRAFT_700832 [Earliella scabrosa]|nr:hypothetical protein C8Q76DRAFT_700832 [Earliella scabrosa]
MHAPAYPTPTSFPRFVPHPSVPPSLDPIDDQKARHRSLATLTTTSATLRPFAAYARLVQECVDRRSCGWGWSSTSCGS